MAESYAPPAGTLPLLAGILAALDFTHRNMIAIVADLPPDALAWKPGPDMGSLAGIVRHTVYCENYALRAATGENAHYDEATNARQWDATDDAATLQTAIGACDTLMKTALPALTVERMGRPLTVWGGPHESSAGELIADAANHTAMHWGQMQMTRQLWEQAHPDFSGDYTRW